MAGPPNEVAPNLRKDRNNVEREGSWERLIIIQIHLSFLCLHMPEKYLNIQKIISRYFWEIFHS
jgi:hypothetical protein